MKLLNWNLCCMYRQMNVEISKWNDIQHCFGPTQRGHPSNNKLRFFRSLFFNYCSYMYACVYVFLYLVGNNNNNKNTARESGHINRVMKSVFFKNRLKARQKLEAQIVQREKKLKRNMDGLTTDNDSYKVEVVAWFLPKTIYIIFICVHMFVAACVCVSQ